MEQRLFQGCPVTGQEPIGNIQNTTSKHEEKPFHCEDDWLQVAQKSCGVYILRDNQKLSGQLALGFPTWEHNALYYMLLLQGL